MPWRGMACGNGKAGRPWENYVVTAHLRRDKLQRRVAIVIEFKAKESKAKERKKRRC